MTLLTLFPGDGRTVGARLTAKLENGQSPDFAVFESELPPGWGGPPPHVHRIYDEALYVLDGSVQFTADDGTRQCPAGSFVFVPRGSTHSFANPAATAASLLVVTTPRAIELVERAEELMSGNDGPPDVAALTALFASHESEILGPPSVRNERPTRPPEKQPRTVPSGRSFSALPVPKKSRLPG